MGTTVLAVAQQKGGVGKSEVTKDLAGAFAVAGKRVLIIDWDPQGDITRMLGVPLSEIDEQRTISAALLGKWEPNHPSDLTVGHGTGIHVVPNALDMHILEPQLHQVRAREHRLSQLVSWIVAADVYDVILIDCPPALGLLMDNASVATDAGDRNTSGVLTVAAPWPIIFGNIQLLEQQLAAARRELAIRAPVVGLVASMYDQRNGAMEVKCHNLLAERPDYLLTVHRRAVISKATAAGTTVEDWDPESEAAGWFRDLAKLVMEGERRG